MSSLTVSASRNYSIDRTGIKFHRELTFDEWKALGMEISPIANSIGFIVGDWCNYGAARYGERYADAMMATGLAYETIRKFAGVARCVESGIRNPNLDFTHHVVVAKVKDPEEQRRWLDLADKDAMSVKRLRKSINAGRHLSPDEANSDEDPSDSGQTTYLSILNDLRRWIKRETDNGPVRKWGKARRAALKQDFQFVVDFHGLL